MKQLTKTAFAGLLVLATAPASARLPLITDDTRTQRPNKTTHQLEFSYDRLRDRDAGVTSKAGVPGMTYTYGISDPLDIYIGTSYARVTVADPSVPSFTRVSGQGDTGIGLKWRFYDKDNLSFAFKPQVTLATGDENKGLGTGRTSGAMTFIAAYEAEPVTWLTNVTYMHNNYKLVADQLANRSNLVRLSAAALLKVGEKARVFADIGTATNSDRTSNTNASYFLTGFIYSPNKDVDFDLGVKFGISNPEVDRTWSMGATFRF